MEACTRREFLRLAAAAAVAGPAHALSYGLVHTVQGPIEISKLGFTLTHEHICVSTPKVRADRTGSLARAVHLLRQARDAGIDTIIDVTTHDIGRDVRFGAEVSRRSGMQIVACTGQHLFASEAMATRSVDELTDCFVRDIERGIDGTGIRAGVIKVATRADVATPAEERALRAAARASKATGIRIETHTHSRRRGGENQADIFESEGLHPSRVALGHSDDMDDLPYLSGLLRRGYTLGMDHINRGAVTGAKVTWQQRARFIKELVDAGFGHRLFLSNDWTFGDEDSEKANPEGLLFNSRKTLPYLEEIGMSPGEIRAITVKNPARFLGTELPLLA